MSLFQQRQTRGNTLSLQHNYSWTPGITKMTASQWSKTAQNKQAWKRGLCVDCSAFTNTKCQASIHFFEMKRRQWLKPLRLRIHFRNVTVKLCETAWFSNLHLSQGLSHGKRYLDLRISAIPTISTTTPNNTSFVRADQLRGRKEGTVSRPEWNQIDMNQWLNLNLNAHKSPHGFLQIALGSINETKRPSSSIHAEQIVRKS